MDDERNFWTRNRISRRAALRGAGLGIAGLAGAALIGCGDDEEDDTGGAAGAAATSAAATSAAATSAAGAAAVPAAAAQAGGTFKSSTNLDVDTFDVQAATSYKTAVITGYVYSRLVQYDIGDGSPAPGSVSGDLAETIEAVDETTYTFKLRQNAPWDSRPPTSGRALDSEDVVQTWLRYKEESAYRKTLANDASENAPIASIEAVDDMTVRMKLAHPDALVLPIMAWYLSGIWVHPKESVDGGFNPAEEMRGNGPWILDEYSPAVSFKFKKNPDWYGGPELPYFDGIDLPIIEDRAQAEAQFRAGNIFTGGNTPAQNFPIIAKEVPGTEIVTAPPSFTGSTLGMNRIPDSGFNDVRVRKALSMSFDRDTFIDVINDPSAFSDVGLELNRTWNTPLSAGYGAFWLDPKSSDFGPGAEFLKHNVAEAKKMLAAAGYDDSSPFEFDLIFPGTRYGQDWPTRAETWQAMAADAGIKAHLWVVDYTTEWIAKPPEGVFRTFSQFEGREGRKSAVTYRPNGGRSTPGEWMNTFHQSTGANNEVGDNYPELDALITAARRMTDFDERVAKMHDIQRYMMENMTTIPTLPTVDATAIKWEGLHGLERYRAWGGAFGSVNSYREVYPLWWVDDTLKG